MIRYSRAFRLPSASNEVSIGRRFGFPVSPDSTDFCIVVRAKEFCLVSFVFSIDFFDCPYGLDVVA